MGASALGILLAWVLGAVLPLGLEARGAPLPEGLFLVGPGGNNAFVASPSSSGAPTSPGFPSAEVGAFESVVAGDFDGNGWSDLFFLHRDGPNRFLMNTGSRWEAGGALDPKEVEGGDLRPEDYDIVLAIDSSWSMADNDPSRLRISAAKAFIDRLNPQRDRVSVVSWDDDIDFNLSLTADFAEAKRRLERIDADGNGTSLNAGLHEAVTELSARGRTGARIRRMVIFLTDGDGDYTPSGTAGSPGARAKAGGIRVLSVGLGKSPDEAKLSDIARATGGSYSRSPDAATLERVFADLVPWKFDFLVSGDFDGNGLDDLFFGSRRGFNRVQYARGPASGLGLTPTWRRADREQEASRAVAEQDAADFDAVVSGDFDGNGLEDLFFFARTGVNRFQYAIPGQGWNRGGGLPETDLEPYDFVVAGDFDGNGRDDLLFWAGNRSVVHYSRSTGWQRAENPVRTGLGSDLGVVAGDYVGLGREDLFVLGVNGVHDFTVRESDADWRVAVGGSRVTTPGFTRAVSGRFGEADASLRASDPNEVVAPPRLTEPVPGSGLTGRNVSFAWTSAQPLEGFQLKVGDGPGGDNLHASGVLPGNATRHGVNDLPDDAREIHVTLMYRRASASPWLSVGYVFRTIGKPELLDPAPGTALSGASVSFRWRPAPNASHRLQVGTSAGGGDVFDTGVVSDAVTTTAPIPVPEGGRVHVRLSHRYEGVGVWRWEDHVFVVPRGPELTEPTPGRLVGDPPVRFSWSANETSVVAWRLTVGTQPGGADLHDSGELAAETVSRVVEDVALDQGTVHVTLHYRTADGAAWRRREYPFGFLDHDSYERILQSLNDPSSGLPADAAVEAARSAMRRETEGLMEGLRAAWRQHQTGGFLLDELVAVVDLVQLHLRIWSDGNELVELLDRSVVLLRRLARASVGTPAEQGRQFARLGDAFRTTSDRREGTGRIEFLLLAAEAWDAAAQAMARAAVTGSTDADVAAGEAHAMAAAQMAERAVQARLDAGRPSAALATARRLADLLTESAGDELLWKTLESVENDYEAFPASERTALGSLQALRAAKAEVLRRMATLEPDEVRRLEATLRLSRDYQEQQRWDQALGELAAAESRFARDADASPVTLGALRAERWVVALLASEPLSADTVRLRTQAIPEEDRPLALALGVNLLGDMGNHRVLGFVGEYLGATDVEPAVRVHYWQAHLRALAVATDASLVETELDRVGGRAEAFLATLAPGAIDEDLRTSFAEQVGQARATSVAVAAIVQALGEPSGAMFQSLAKQALSLGRWDLAARCLGRHVVLADLPAAQRTRDRFAGRFAEAMEVIRAWRIRLDQPDVPAADQRLAREHLEGAVATVLARGREELQATASIVGSIQQRIFEFGLGGGTPNLLEAGRQEVLAAIRRLALLMAGLQGMFDGDQIPARLAELERSIMFRRASLLSRFAGLPKLENRPGVPERYRALANAMGEVDGLQAERDGWVDYLLRRTDAGATTHAGSRARLFAELESIDQVLNGVGGMRQQLALAESVWTDPSRQYLHQVYHGAEVKRLVSRRFELIALYPFQDHAWKLNILQTLLKREKDTWANRLLELGDQIVAEEILPGLAPAPILYILGGADSGEEVWVSRSAYKSLGDLGNALKEAERDLLRRTMTDRREDLLATLRHYRLLDPAQVVETKSVRLPGGSREERRITAAQKGIEVLGLLLDLELTGQRDKYVDFLRDYQDTSIWDAGTIKTWTVHRYLFENLDEFARIEDEHARLRHAMGFAASLPASRLTAVQRALLTRKGFLWEGQYRIPGDVELIGLRVRLADEIVDESILLTAPSFGYWMVF